MLVGPGLTHGWEYRPLNPLRDSAFRSSLLDSEFIRDPFPIFDWKSDRDISKRVLERPHFASVTDDKFEAKVDVSDYSPSEITVKVLDHDLVIEGKHEEKDDPNNFILRNFVRRYTIPDHTSTEKMTSTYCDKDGVLKITAPREMAKSVPEETVLPIKVESKDSGISDCAESPRKAQSQDLNR